MGSGEHHAETGLRDRPAADLVRQVRELVPRLVREEMALAKAELRQKGKAAGTGAGLFGGGGLVAFYAVRALVTAAILALAQAMPGWAAALIVGVALLAIAAVLGLVPGNRSARPHRRRRSRRSAASSRTLRRTGAARQTVRR